MIRIRDWRITFLLLLFFCIAERSFGASTKSSPILVHSDPKDEKEFQNLYQTISNAPSIFFSAGAPAFTPPKAGDIDISTTTQKVYIATAAVTSASWVIVN